MMTKNEKIGVLMEVQEKLYKFLLVLDDARDVEECYGFYKNVVTLDCRMTGIRNAIELVSELIQEEEAKCREK